MQCASNPRLHPFFRSLVWWERHKIRKAGGLLGEPREASLLPDTELLIDGYQGSANSFFLRAFRYVQPRPVPLAHHLHAATAVRLATRLGIPAVVTIRDPAESARSVVKRWPYVSVIQALRHHARYYEALEPEVGTFVLSPFTATTRRPDLVIEAINARFGTAFASRRLTPAELAAVRPEPTFAKRVEEERTLEEKQEEWERPEVQRWLKAAELVYDRMLAHAPPELLALSEE